MQPVLECRYRSMLVIPIFDHSMEVGSSGLDEFYLTQARGKTETAMAKNAAMKARFP